MSIDFILTIFYFNIWIAGIFGFFLGVLVFWLPKFFK